ncbi:hypothetical protein [Stenomitos frigidus]|uniref:Uncharacterized protein n=1 Tax=Stenomitos frigidus ULC18 TaxID=2107698 RepID=A0A2T1DTF0_9CYAN|nr:hypothetical protein [Stenomitos frigidus]PSB23701.1 hypothetical protein C7B82_29660 [Stenomitos frigidus ULC18]
MIFDDFNNIEVKPDTRNHRGCFVQETSYKLVNIDRAGWAFICMNDAVCYYVDPDNLQQAAAIEIDQDLVQI